MEICGRCGRKVQKRSHGMCKNCRRRAKPDGVPILHPRDDEMEFLYDGLIAQRKQRVKPWNFTRTENPEEEKEIRRKLGL